MIVMDSLKDKYDHLRSANALLLVQCSVVDWERKRCCSSLVQISCRKSVAAARYHRRLDLVTDADGQSHDRHEVPGRR